jgi:hypothetical protein
MYTKNKGGFKMTNVRKEISTFLKGQSALGVKRNEIARSLFARKYSEHQVATIMGIHPKSAHAMKKSIIHGEIKERKEIANFLKGNLQGINDFFHNLKIFVGSPAHTKEAEIQRKRLRRQAREAKAQATA